MKRLFLLCVSFVMVTSVWMPVGTSSSLNEIPSKDDPSVSGDDHFGLSAGHLCRFTFADHPVSWRFGTDQLRSD